MDILRGYVVSQMENLSFIKNLPIDFEILLICQYTDQNTFRNAVKYVQDLNFDFFSNWDSVILFNQSITLFSKIMVSIQIF